MPGALDHLLVLDLTSHLSGPYCAMLLADHGAEVIKIEPPKGDSARNMPPFVNGESAPFMTWNRNKRSAVMDLKQPTDHVALPRLIDQADCSAVYVLGRPIPCVAFTASAMDASGRLRSIARSALDPDCMAPDRALKNFAVVAGRGDHLRRPVARYPQCLRSREVVA